jgi:lipopolysaccharide assembly protein A
MRYLRWIAVLGVALVLLAFGAKNTDQVRVQYFLGWEWHAPLVEVLFVFFVVGAALGVLAGAASRYRQRRELARLRRELRQRHSTHELARDLAREHRLQ